MKKHLRWVIVALLLILLGLALTPGHVDSYVAPLRSQEPHIAVFPTITAEVSGYSSEVAQTDSAPFTTASGLIVSDGTLACPTRYEFGTKVTIQGKEYRCEDRMAARYREGNFFDIWFPHTETAIHFGRQTLEVLVHE